MSKNKHTPEVIVKAAHLLQSGTITNATLQAYIDAVYGEFNAGKIVATPDPATGAYKFAFYEPEKVCKCPTCLPTDKDYGKKPVQDFVEGEVIDGVVIKAASLALQ